MKLFAWISFALAVVAGAGLAATGAGLVQVIVVAVAVTALVVDIVKDRIPNLAAVGVAVALPSLIVGMNGKLAQTLSHWLGSLWGKVGGTASDWAGTTSMLGVAIAAVAVSFVIGRRTMPKTGGGR